MDVNWLRRSSRTARKYARLAAVEALCRFSAGERESDSQRAFVQVLLMHDLRKADCDRFRKLLHVLSDKYEFVRYSDAVNQIVSGAIDKPKLAFSFDDGFHGCWEAAAILEEFDTRGAFFICPDIVEASVEVQAKICRERLWLEPTPFLTWREIETLKGRGHEFGSHTQSHYNIASLNRDVIQKEFAESKQQITARLGECSHFAWPYGRFSNFSVDAYKAAVDVGYRSSASGERGSHAPHCCIAPVVPCIRRESIDIQWPLRHIQYFLNQSGRSALAPNECWPMEWDLDISVGTALKRVA